MHLAYAQELCTTIYATSVAESDTPDFLQLRLQFAKCTLIEDLNVAHLFAPTGNYYWCLYSLWLVFTVSSFYVGL